MMRAKRGKKAISNMVSYVLLVVIALGMAAGVYSWMKFYATIPGEEDKCPEEVALVIKSYECSKVDKIISLKVENKGFFDINGLYAKGAKQADMLATISLKADGKKFAAGEYHFDPALAPTEITVLNFSYAEALPEGLAKLQIQPFIYTEERRSSCKNIVNLEIPEEKECK